MRSYIILYTLYTWQNSKAFCYYNGIHDSTIDNFWSNRIKIKSISYKDKDFKQRTNNLFLNRPLSCSNNKSTTNSGIRTHLPSFSSKSSKACRGYDMWMCVWVSKRMQCRVRLSTWQPWHQKLCLNLTPCWLATVNVRLLFATKNFETWIYIQVYEDKEMYTYIHIYPSYLNIK